MRRFHQIRLIAVLAWAIVAAPLAKAADPDPEFIAARQAFLKEMKKKSPAARADAIAVYAKFPLADTAETLLKKGLGDLDPTVRVATRVALREIGRDPATARSVSEEFKR